MPASTPIAVTRCCADRLRLPAALIYNLIRTGPGALPSPPDYEREQSQVADLLRSWRPGHEVGMDPVKVVYPLEHAYTQAEIGFSTLKGADAAVAGVLAGAAAEADCDLHLALLTMEETGWAEYAGGSWRDPEFEIGEVDDHREILHDWCLPDGRRPALGELPFDYEEVSPSGALDDLCGAEADFSEATGNEGASFDRLYQSAALVLWPRSGRALVVSKAGLRASLPYLGDLVLQWQGAQGAERDRLYREATGLAAEIRAQWPTGQWERGRASEAGQGSALLSALLTLGDPEGAAGFIADQTTAGAYGPADNAVLA